MPYIELFYLLIPISFIFIILSLYFYVHIKTKKFNFFFKKKQKENNPTSNQKYMNELRSLNFIKNYGNTKKVKEDAATMVWKIEKLKSENLKLSIEGNKATEKFQIFHSARISIKINQNESEINKLSKSFFKKVGNVLENIKVIRNKINFYRDGLRKLKVTIKEDIIEKQNKISYGLINDEFQKIEIQLKTLDELVGSNQIDESANLLQQVKENFLKIINFSNNCVDLEKNIFDKLPIYFKKLEILFYQAQINTNCDFKYIIFHERTAKIKDNYKLLKEYFTIENWEKAKQLCNEILSSLFNLNNEINGEIDAYNFMMKNAKLLNEHKKNISKLFISIKDEFTKLQRIDSAYSPNYEENISSLNTYLTEVDEIIEKIINDENNFNISFSSKLFKYKSLFYKLKGFYFLYVDLTKKIEIFYLEGESKLLKFERLTVLFRTFNSYVKNNYIIINNDELENTKKIDNIQQKIFNIILVTQSNISPNIDNEFEKLLLLMIEYMNTVGLKVEQSKTFKKVINLLAAQRSSNIKLNECIVSSENLYLEGDYYWSLEKIIDTINKGVN